MKDGLRIGLAGYGRIGTIHLQNLVQHPQVAHIALCDPKQVKLPNPDIPLFNKIDALLNQWRPDILFICSPTPSHVEMIEACCARGIHVFCEKPVDLDIDRIKQIEKRIAETGIAVHVGFNRRFDPDFMQLKRKIQDDLIGAIHQITITSRDPGFPSMAYIASSGGMLLDMTIHDFDMSLFLTGGNIQEVYTKGQIRVDPALSNYKDIDTATSVLTFDNEVTCTIINSREAVYGYDQRIEVFGAKGMLSVDNQLVDRINLSDQQGRRNSPPEPFFLERYANSYQLEIDDFLNRVLTGQPPSVCISDAIRATEIALMANESMRLGRVVTVLS